MGIFTNWFKKKEPEQETRGLFCDSLMYNMNGSYTTNKATGNPMTAATGLVQLSYCAASTRKATINAIIRTMVVVFPAWVS